MATNGVRASSVASSTGSSFVDASGFKFSKDDQKIGKVKLKRPTKKKAEANKTEDAVSRSSSPILPDMDDATHAAFPDGKPREAALETIICKHCKRPVLKKNAKEHITACIKSKQEKAKKKKEAREAAAREKAKAERGDEKDEDGKAGPDDDSEIKVEPAKTSGARKSAIKSAKDDEKKGKKRKADDDDKEPKKKKKKDEQKPKVPKPKGPVDVEKQCGVLLGNNAQCARSLTCKTHSMGAKRGVPGRSLPYDMLLQAYQKKNQARQQKAAIDANAPHNFSDSDMIDPAFGGTVDSDEEKDNVMTALRRSFANPQPLAQHIIFPQKKKYQLVRMKEILGNAMVGNRGGVGLFSVVVDGGQQDSVFAVPQTETNGTGGLGGPTASKGEVVNGSGTPASGNVARKPSAPVGQPKMRKPSIASSIASTAAGD